MAEQTTIPTTTPDVRISHPHLFTPKYYGKVPKEGEVPKYMITPIFPKNDPAVQQYLNNLHQIIQNLIQEVWPNPNDQPRIPIVGNEIAYIKDADISVGQKDRIPVLEKYPERAGHWYFNTTNQDRPDVLDLNCQEILKTHLIYPGCWCRINLHPWAWENENGRGISFQVNGVQFRRDDAPFSTRTRQTAEQMFGAGGPGAQNPQNYAPNPNPGPQAGFNPAGSPGPGPGPGTMPNSPTGQPQQNFNPNPGQPQQNFNPNPGQPQQNFNPNPGQPAGGMNPNPAYGPTGGPAGPVNPSGAPATASQQFYDINGNPVNPQGGFNDGMRY